MDDKIINNSFNQVDYGTERTSQSSIRINPFVEDMYEDTISDKMDEIYNRKRMMEIMDEIYSKSKYYDKYGSNNKKIERSDILDIYYYFKNELRNMHEFAIVDIFYTIAEFFDFNYKTLYNDILTLEDKVSILEYLENEMGLEKQFAQSKPLF